MHRTVFYLTLALGAQGARADAQQIVRVNAPVAPDTIYVARTGDRAGISVIDLNGFGQSTGDPTFSLSFGPGSEHESKSPWNPNLSLQGALLVPPLSVGTTTLDGGSAGVFTLTKDSSLDDLLVESPTVGSVGDMMLGHPLDLVFNNGSPFGCQVAGGNLCSQTGLKILAVALGGPTTLVPMFPASSPLQTTFGAGNAISFAPHPNPPPIVTPPLCLSPLIQGQEPTSVFSAQAPPFGAGLANLLTPGARPLGDPQLGIPPDGLLAREQNAFFTGPSATQPNIASCQPFAIRQQIGHFLYAVDAARDEVTILNSNSFAVLGRVSVPTPGELAMDPNLSFLAVVSRGLDEVWFIDIDPASRTFHTVVERTGVGSAPAGIAWDPSGEDILVCNEGDSSLSILSAKTLEVRKTVRSGLERPFAIAITPRQSGFGFERDVYFAYVLERSGRVALFESGPGGSSGWGYDDIVGFTPFRFRRPHAMQPDPLRLSSGVWIAHSAKLDAQGVPIADGGAVSNLVLDSTINGRQLLVPGQGPSLRGLSFRIERSIGRDELSGTPIDLAFDNQRNLGALMGLSTQFSARPGIPVNSKGLVRVTGSGFQATNSPALMFLAVKSQRGRRAGIDVIELDSGTRVDTNAFHPGTQSIPVPGATRVMDYFRQ